MTEAHHRTRRFRWGFAAMLAALATLGPFSIDAYLPAFSGIQESLGATPLEIQQTLSVYLFAFGLMFLFHGALSDSFGRRPVILVALAVYTIASAGAALATDVHTLILWRAVQGLSVGAGIPGRAPAPGTAAVRVALPAVHPRHHARLAALRARGGALRAQPNGAARVLLHGHRRDRQPRLRVCAAAVGAVGGDPDHDLRHRLRDGDAVGHADHARPLSHAARHGRLAAGLRLGNGERRHRRRNLAGALEGHAAPRHRDGGANGDGLCMLAPLPALGAKKGARRADASRPRAIALDTP